MASITGTTGAVVGTYIVNITDEEDRVRHFGLMSVCFGMSMVVGPVARRLLGTVFFYLVCFGDDSENL